MQWRAVFIPRAEQAYSSTVFIGIALQNASTLVSQRRYRDKKSLNVTKTVNGGLVLRFRSGGGALTRAHSLPGVFLNKVCVIVSDGITEVLDPRGVCGKEEAFKIVNYSAAEFSAAAYARLKMNCIADVKQAP